MKEALKDLVRNVAPHFSQLKITGTDDATKIEAFTEEKNLFLIGYFKETVQEFHGEFGIGSLSLLKGLLDFPSYKTDEAKFLVHRAVREETDIVAEFEFRDKTGGKTKFRTMHPRMVGEQAKIASITWDLTFTPTKAKVTEMAQLAGLLSEVDKMFGLKIEDGMLYMTIGGGSEVTHSASIGLMETAEKNLPDSGNWMYDTPNFLSVLKNAGNGQVSVNFSSRGVIGMTIETDKAVYCYYLRGKQA
jgi:hypothetical protein